jgi:hypothetical protein
MCVFKCTYTSMINQNLTYIWRFSGGFSRECQRGAPRRSSSWKRSPRKKGAGGRADRGRADTMILTTPMSILAEADRHVCVCVCVCMCVYGHVYMCPDGDMTGNQAERASREDKRTLAFLMSTLAEADMPTSFKSRRLGPAAPHVRPLTRVSVVIG